MSTVRIVALLASVLCLVGCTNPKTQEQVKSVKYRGERFEVIRPLGNFDDTDDRSYVRVEDGERIEQLMREAPIAKSFATFSEVLAAVDEIRFPGYDRSLLPEQRSVDPADKSTLTLIAVEIPRRFKSRSLVFRAKPDGGYDLVDDFILEPKPAKPNPPPAKGEEPAPTPDPEPQTISSIVFKGEKIRYLDASGAIVREK